MVALSRWVAGSIGAVAFDALEGPSAGQFETTRVASHCEKQPGVQSQHKDDPGRLRYCCRVICSAAGRLTEMGSPSVVISLRVSRSQAGAPDNIVGCVYYSVMVEVSSDRG